MTKADIVEVVHNRTGFSKKESSETVEAILEILKEELEEGEKVKLSGEFAELESKSKKDLEIAKGEFDDLVAESSKEIDALKILNTGDN